MLPVRLPAGREAGGLAVPSHESSHHVHWATGFFLFLKFSRSVRRVLEPLNKHQWTNRPTEAYYLLVGITRHGNESPDFC